MNSRQLSDQVFLATETSVSRVLLNEPLGISESYWPVPVPVHAMVLNGMVALPLVRVAGVLTVRVALLLEEPLVRKKLPT